MEDLQEILLRLVEEVDRRRFGKHRGFVADNEDPERRGRLRLRVPSVLGEQVSAWALPCLPFGGADAHGFFAVPERDAQVWVEFEEGDIDRPIWTGTFWQREHELPEGAARERPNARVLATPSGHVMRFDDAEGEERFTLAHPANADLEIAPSGRITLTDPQGSTLSIDPDAKRVVLEQTNGNQLTMTEGGTTVVDANGNRVEMRAGGITVEGAQVIVRGSQVVLGELGGEPLIKGQSFLQLFMTHRHTVAPLVGGPTSPPVPQGEMSTLSTKVTTT